MPVHDQRRTAKSKNYRRSVNVQVVCRARDRRVVAVGDAWPGNRNDIVVFRETFAKTLPDHPRLSGDGGYRGCDRIRTPRRGPDGRIIKDRTYHRFRKRRAVAEHTIARLKDHQILRHPTPRRPERSRPPRRCRTPQPQARPPVNGAPSAAEQVPTGIT